MSDSATLWTAGHWTPLSVGLSRQDYWSGLPCLPPGDLPDPGIEPESLTSPALAHRFCLPLGPLGKPGMMVAPYHSYLLCGIPSSPGFLPSHLLLFLSLFRASPSDLSMAHVAAVHSLSRICFFATP